MRDELDYKKLRVNDVQDALRAYELCAGTSEMLELLKKIGGVDDITDLAKTKYADVVQACIDAGSKIMGGGQAFAKHHNEIKCKPDAEAPLAKLLRDDPEAAAKQIYAQWNGKPTDEPAGE